MRYLISISIVFFLGTLVFGQQITYFGEVSDYDGGGKLSGVNIKVFQDGKEVSSAVTQSGKYSVKFDPGKKYKIEYSKQGYVSKFINVDVTKVNSEELPPGGKIFAPINLDLFADRPGVDFSFLKNEPVATWFFDNDRMDFDKKQAVQIKDKVKDLLEQAEKNNANADAQYNSIIGEADKLYDAANYEEALKKYESALKISGKATEPHPNNRILEISDLLQKKAAEELDKKQGNSAYDNLIEAGNNLAKNKEYDKALDKFDEASRLKPDEQYPYDRIDEITEEKNNEKKRAEYDELIKRGDSFLKQNSLQAARDKYLDAQKLLPNEEYPKNKIEEINKKLDAQSEIREKKEKYNQTIEEADKLYDSEEYEAAIEKYKEAITYESAASYPGERIKMAEERWEIQKKEQEKLNQFQELVQQGDEKINEKEYEEAVNKYTAALELFPENQEAKEKQNKANELLQEKIQNAEKWEQFNQLVEEGDQKTEAKEYEAAIEKYTTALSVFEEEDIAVVEKRENAQNLLKIQQENAEKLDQFNLLVEEADKKTESKEYEAAIEKYDEALALITDHQEVITKKENAQKLFLQAKESAEQQELFDQLVKEGDEKVDQQELTAALEKYNAALEIIEEETVKTKIEQVNERIKRAEESAEKSERIKNLFLTAEEKMLAKNYATAIEDFEAIIAIIGDDAIGVTGVNEDYQKATEGKEKALELLGEQELFAEQQEQIDGLLLSASEKMASEKYTEAINDFSAVLALDENNATALEGKKEAEEKLSEKLSAEEKEVLNQQIQELLNTAEELKPENKWEEVIQKYEEALSLDNTRNDIENLLEEAQKSKENWETQLSNEENFAQLAKEGATLMEQEEWAAALSKFEAALSIKQDEEVASKLETAKQKIAEANELMGKEEQFQDLMKKGEELLGTEDYENALATFQQAVEVKEDETARAKMEEIKGKLAEISAQDGRYQSAMEQGNKALEENDFAEALKYFEDALTEKPGDEEATQQKEKAINQLNSLKETEEQFKELMKLANDLFEKATEGENKGEELLLAKEKFKEAQTLNPSASEPQNKIVEIDNLLREMESALAEQQKEALEKAYQAQLDLAKTAGEEEKYTEAIAFLEEASKLKPEEKFPKDKKQEYEAKLGQLQEVKELENKFAGFINQADEAFSSEAFSESIDLYKKALAIFPEKEYPQSQIKLAETNLEKQQKEEAERNYQNIVQEANRLFDNKEYEKALEGYSAAFAVKKEDEFVNDRIKETNEIIKELKAIAEREEAERNYQNTVKNANQFFDDKQFEKALETYQTAFAVKSDDTYVQDRIDETKQILKNLQIQAEKQAAIEKQFQNIISEADKLFEDADFIQAKSKYQEALQLKPEDTYADSQIELCETRQLDKEKKEAEERYQGILAQADDFFEEEDYESALLQYEKAQKERSNDTYPQKKIEEIKQIMYELARMNSHVEYLGQKSNISIIEGAALLGQGAKQIEQLRRKAVEEQIYKNEDKIVDLSLSDYQQRVNLRTEVTDVENERAQLIVEEIDQHWNFLNFVNEYDGELEKIRIQFNKFQQGKVGRNYKETEYIVAEMEDHKRGLSEQHHLISEKVNQIEGKSYDLARTGAAHHKVSVIATSEELLKIEKQNEELPSFNTENLVEIHAQIKLVEDGKEVKDFQSKSIVYDRLVRLEEDATSAEKLVAEKNSHQVETHREIQSGVYELSEQIQQKRMNETNEAHDAQLEIDELVTQSEKQYLSAQEGKDDGRQFTVSQVIEMEEESEALQDKIANRNYREKQEITDEVEELIDLRIQQASHQKQDLSQLNENLKSQIDNYEKAESERKTDDQSARQESLKQLELITKKAEATVEGKEETTKDNYEGVKEISASAEEQSQEIGDLLKDKKQRTQEMVDQLENNKLTFSPLLANTIGEEYPEGVTQENYIRKDKNGIPVKIVTRRFVVQDGHGDIFIRMQTRNGLTYSKNGNPISEQGWINGTENAKLEKHYN